jgi:VanZ family protein
MLITALVTLIIAYGSLYPFVARHPRPSEGAVLYLLSTWDEAPVSGGNTIANIMLYMPFGFFAYLAITGDGRIRRPLRAVTLAGIALSTTMELGQFFDSFRVCNFSDLYTNGGGAFLGAVAARIIGPEIKLPFARHMLGDLFAGLLLASWFLSRLYPYVPTIDLHKYWHAVQPLIHAPSVSLVDLIRFTVCWAFIAWLCEALWGANRGRAYRIMAAVEIVGKIFILNNALKQAEVFGIVVGAMLWTRVRVKRRPEMLMAAIFAGFIVIERLRPFSFGGPLHDFGWVPFGGFMGGSVSVNTQSFLEKFFYYGAMLWALIRTGMGLGPAAGLLAGGLFLTSLAETALPGRSAEITDAVMALAIAMLYRAIDQRRVGATASQPPRTGQTIRSAPR